MKNSIRLCLIAPVPPPYGGIGNWVTILKNYVLKRNDIVMDIINISPLSRGIDGRTVWNRIIAQGAMMIKKGLDLYKLVIDKRPDVIHITTSGQLAIIRDILLLLIAKSKKIPTVYHIRFGRIRDIASKNSIEWKILLVAMKIATNVMAIDRITFNTICEYLPFTKVTCIPNPIEISMLPKPECNKSKTIMFLGWIINTKGIEELLKAWNKIFQRHSDWCLGLVGPYKNDYYKYLKDKYSFDGVTFEGEKDHKEAIELLNDSDIFILPSYTEGFPNVLLEAMALAKPIIATKVGAIPEMLANDCGILIDTKDAKQIEYKLEGLINDENRRSILGHNAFNKLINEYTIEKVFDKYMNVWRLLCPGATICAF